MRDLGLTSVLAILCATFSSNPTAEASKRQKTIARISFTTADHSTAYAGDLGGMKTTRAPRRQRVLRQTEPIKPGAQERRTKVLVSYTAGVVNETTGLRRR